MAQQSGGEGMRQFIFSRVAWAIVALLVTASRSNAQPQTAPATQPSGPQSTFVGLYINDLYQLDLKQSTYTADFYVWMRWRGDIDPSNFEFLNGNLDLKEHPYSIEANGEKYVSYHCRGTFHAVFDYHRYPLD